MKYRKNKIQKNWRQLAALAVLIGVLSFAVSGKVSAIGGAPASGGTPKLESCTAKDNTGTEYPGTKNDKGECIYFKTGSNNTGKKAGDPGVAYCGDKEKNAVVMSINIGCKGKGNAILDALFAIIRFATLGVSFVIIASMVAAGIQFTASRGDPQATAGALKRMASNASALLLFIFTYAILNWLVPNTILR